MSDGQDQETKAIAIRFGARYHEHPKPGEWDGGNRCRDLGIVHARGQYVAFWDDDNSYWPHSLATQYAAAYGAGIGVTQVFHRQLGKVIPEVPFVGLALGHVDTACLCVRLELARTAGWSDSQCGRCGDWRWLERLLLRVDEFGGVRFVPVVTAGHL